VRRPGLSTLVLVLALAVLLMSPPLAAFAAPDNDDRATATVVDALPFRDHLFVGDATSEHDEPENRCAPTGMTVWYSLTLPEKTPVVVDTIGSEYDTVAAVYTTDLREVACNDDAGMMHARVAFSASRNTTYLIQIGAYGGAFQPWEEPWLSVTIDRGTVRDIRPKPVHSRFVGSHARAVVQSVTEDTYAESMVWLFEAGQGRDRFDEVLVNDHSERYDEEKGTLTFESWWGFAPFEDAAIGTRLDTAHVNQELVVEGWTCTVWPEEEAEPEDCRDLGSSTVALDVLWTGYGPLSRYTETHHDQGAWGSYSYRGTFRHRFAHVVGGAVGEVVEFDLTGGWATLGESRELSLWRPARS
jgi:hypothetical protein